MKKVLTALVNLLAFLAGFIGVTFTVYWFNADMKLVRFIYEKLQPHYDNMKRDRRL